MHCAPFLLTMQIIFASVSYRRVVADLRINSAIAGLKSFLNGDTLKVAKEKMITTYDTQIAALDITDPMAAVELVHNKEALVFDGNDDLLFSDLQ